MSGPRLYSNPTRLAAHGGEQLKELKLLAAEVVAAARDDFSMPALCYAARTGDVETIRYMLSDAVKADINARGWAGMSSLLFACASASEGAVDALLAAGADVSAADEGGNTALHYACKSGSVAIISALLGAGAAINARNSVGRTPLHTSAAHGQAAAVAALLKADASISEADSRGWTALVRSVITPICIFSTLMHRIAKTICARLFLLSNHTLAARCRCIRISPADAGAVGRWSRCRRKNS